MFGLLIKSTLFLSRWIHFSPNNSLALSFDPVTHRQQPQGIPKHVQSIFLVPGSHLACFFLLPNSTSSTSLRKSEMSLLADAPHRLFALISCTALNASSVTLRTSVEKKTRACFVVDKHNLHSVMCDTKTELGMIHYFFHLVKCSKEIKTSIFTLLHFNRYFHVFIILCFETWQPLVSLHVTVYRSIRHACIHSFHAFRCTRTHALHKNFLRILTWMHMMVPIKVWHGCTFTHINTCNLWEIITLLWKKGQECVSTQHREAPHPPTDLQFGVMWFFPSSWAFSHFWIVVKGKTHYTYPKLQHTAKEMCDMWHSFCIKSYVYAQPRHGWTPKKEWMRER